MKVKVTSLKAPWPRGATVGSVVEVGDAIPGCFAGKCSPCDEPADHVYEPAGPLRLSVSEPRPAPTVAQMEALQAENAALRAMLEAGGGGPGVPTVAAEAASPARRSR
jgi:hypothetical protein